jgi:hypothetical protein
VALLQDSLGRAAQGELEFGRLIAAGAFKRGTPLAVHAYSEHFRP